MGWRYCVSHSKTESSPSAARRRAASPSRRTSCSWAPKIRVLAVTGATRSTPARAAQLNRATSPVQPSAATRSGSPARCWTGSTSTSRFPRVPFQKLATSAAASRRRPTSARSGRVEAARAQQSARFANVKDGQGAGLTTNADMGPTQVRDHYPVDEAAAISSARPCSG